MDEVVYQCLHQTKNNIHNLSLYEQWNEHDDVFQLLGLPDIDDDTYEQYHGDVEEEPETDHQQMGVSQ